MSKLRIQSARKVHVHNACTLPCTSATIVHVHAPFRGMHHALSEHGGTNNPVPPSDTPRGHVRTGAVLRIGTTEPAHAVYRTRGQQAGVCVTVAATTAPAA